MNKQEEKKLKIGTYIIGFKDTKFTKIFKLVNKKHYLLIYDKVNPSRVEALYDKKLVPRKHLAIEYFEVIPETEVFIEAL